MPPLAESKLELSNQNEDEIYKKINLMLQADWRAPVLTQVAFLDICREATASMQRARVLHTPCLTTQLKGHRVVVGRD